MTFPLLYFFCVADPNYDCLTRLKGFHSTVTQEEKLIVSCKMAKKIMTPHARGFRKRRTIVRHGRDNSRLESPVLHSIIHRAELGTLGRFFSSNHVYRQHKKDMFFVLHTKQHCKFQRPNEEKCLNKRTMTYKGYTVEGKAKLHARRWHFVSHRSESLKERALCGRMSEGIIRIQSLRALYVSAKAKKRVVYSLPKLSSEAKNKRAFPILGTQFFTLLVVY